MDVDAIPFITMPYVSYANPGRERQLFTFHCWRGRWAYRLTARDRKPSNCYRSIRWGAEVGDGCCAVTAAGCWREEIASSFFRNMSAGSSKLRYCIG